MWVVSVGVANIRPPLGRENRDEGMHESSTRTKQMGGDSRDGKVGWGATTLGVTSRSPPRSGGSHGNTLVVDTNEVPHNESSPLLHTTSAKFWSGGWLGGRGGGGARGRLGERE